MYESPITLVEQKLHTAISEKRDDYILATIEKTLDCEVDKEELIKALNYDRNQYEKGFRDGCNEMDKVYIVIEDTGFCTEGKEDEYISIIDINSCTHFIVHSVCTDKELAEKTLRDIVEKEAEEWETDPEPKEMCLSGGDQTVQGMYLLGSFYYIQEMVVNK